MNVQVKEPTNQKLLCNFIWDRYFDPGGFAAAIYSTRQTLGLFCSPRLHVFNNSKTAILGNIIIIITI